MGVITGNAKSLFLISFYCLFYFVKYFKLIIWIIGELFYNLITILDHQNQNNQDNTAMLIHGILFAFSSRGRRIA